MPASNYRDYLKSLPSNDDGNKNSSAFHGAFDNDSSRRDRLKSVTEDEDNVLVAADGSGGALVAHSVANRGGTIRRKKKKFIAIVGMDQEGVAIELMEESLAVDCSFAAPSHSNYDGCKDEKEFRNLKPPSKGRKNNFKGANCMLLAPYLVDAIAGEDSSDPSKLALAAIHAAKEFDKSDAGLDTDYEPAIDHANVFADLMWGIVNGKVPEAKIALRPGDAELKAHLADRRKKCLHKTAEETYAEQPSATDATDVLRMVMTTMSRNNEMIEETNKLSKLEFQRKSEKESESKNKLSKLHPSVKTFILNAASEDGEFAANEVPESCAAVFNQDSAGMSEREVLVRLRTAGSPDVNFAHGVTQALLTGQFLYFEPGRPSNFSIFSFQKKLVDARDCTHRMLLHIRARDGRSKSSDEIKESLKQVVIAPASITQLFDQVEIFAKTVRIFFGSNKSHKAFVKLGKRIKQDESELLHAAAADSKLPTKLAYAVDKQHQRWMKQCEVNDGREMVNDNLLDFDSIVEDCLNDRLSVRLPDVFNEVGSGGGGPPSPAPRNEPRGRKRKSPSEPVDDDNYVKNEHPVPEFVATDEEKRKYAELFGGDNVCHRVDWDDSGKIKMCPRWHSKEHCFKSCKHKSSHVPANKIPADKKRKYNSYLNQQIRKS